MAQRLEIARETVDGVKRGRVVHQPVGQVAYRSGMRNVMAFNQIPKQDGVEIFLVGFDPQVAREAGDLREAARLPVFLEGLLNEEPFLCGQSARALDALIVQEFLEENGNISHESARRAFASLSP